MIDSIVCFIGRLWTLLVTTLLAVGHDFDGLFLFLLSLDYSESLFEPFCSQQWRQVALLIIFFCSTVLNGKGSPRIGPLLAAWRGSFLCDLPQNRQVRCGDILSALAAHETC